MAEIVDGIPSFRYSYQGEDREYNSERFFRGVQNYIIQQKISKSGPKGYLVPRLSNISGDLPYRVVDKTGQRFNSMTISGHLNSAGLKTMGEAIYQANTIGIKAEWDTLAASYGSGNELITAINNMNTFFKGDYNREVDKYLSTTIQEVLDNLVRIGKVKEEYLRLDKAKTASVKEVEKFIEELTTLLGKCNMFNKSNEELLALDKDMVTNMNMWKRFCETKLDPSYANPLKMKDANGANLVNQGIYKLFSVPMEQFLAQAISESLKEFRNEAVEVCGGETNKVTGYGVVTQSKIDVGSKELGISAKNYMYDYGKKTTRGTPSIHSGDFDKQIEAMGWNRNLIELFYYSQMYGDNKSEFKTLVEQMLSSILIGGFPGDRVQLIAYANHIHPLYEYFEQRENVANIGTLAVKGIQMPNSKGEMKNAKLNPSFGKYYNNKTRAKNFATSVQATLRKKKKKKK